MRLELSEIANIAEIVGTAAVVVSLIYFGIQERDSTRAVRSAAVNYANVSLQAWYLNISNIGQLSEL